MTKGTRQERPASVPRERLPPLVVALGLTSLLTDIGTEMIFPLLPLFLAQSLGASTAFIGLIEGAADATASLLKLASGAYSDRLSRRKPLVVFGYGLASAVRPLVGFATAPWHVLAVRVTDRIGKGIRSSPRDALLADSAPPGQAGRAFGFHQAMDHAGAVIGPLLASGLVALGLALRSIFLLAAVPGAFATLAVSLIHEAPRRREPAAPDTAPVPASSPLPRKLTWFLVVVAVFSLGNSSDAFLLLRARDLGVSTAAIPILWTALSLSKLSSAYLGGAWSDRWPRVRFIGAGWAVYAVAYIGLAFANDAMEIWVLFLFYGLYYGLTEPTQKALVRDMTQADKTIRGRAFGWYNFVVGASALPAGLLTGWLWHAFGPAFALACGAALAAIATLALLFWSAATAD